MLSLVAVCATLNAAPVDDANAAYSRGDYAQAFKIFRSLAAQGNADAQFRIGDLYYQGRGVAPNYQEAMKWFRLAAAQGHGSALNTIGVMYYKGLGVTQDYQEAMKWYKLSAAQGDRFPQNGIGVMYYEGLGVTQNYQEAMKWFRISGDKGYRPAQYNIGLMYGNGDGVTQDYQTAMKWFSLASGPYEITYGIDSIHGNGEGTTKDYQEGLEWYKHHAARGYENGMEYLKVPGMVAPVQNSTPDRRSTSIKKNIQSVEQTNIKTNQKTEKPKRTANRIPPQERALPPRLIFNASTPSADGSVELSGRVISDVNIAEISINDRFLETPLTKNGSFTIVRRLPVGTTTYRLRVVDELDQKVEAEINVERAAIQYTDEVAHLNPLKLKAQANPNAIALIIGVESYLNLPQAKYAGSDANHFYDYANRSLGVPPNKIKLLTDSKASRTELLKIMKGWMKTEIVSGKSDVYIFFAGHGLASTDGNKTYLLPADGDRDLLDETSILKDDLIASAQGAKTITLFLDTCYSGGTRTNEVLIADARPIAIVPDKTALPSNVTVLAAASGSQLSSTYEAAKQGLFSYWLMKGLEGDADVNKDKKITAGELHEYVAKNVGPMAQRRNRQQDPQLMGDRTRVLVSY